MTMNMLRSGCAVAVICSVLIAAGCKIREQGSGEDKKVSIEAPGASVHVDTQASASDSGIPLYPGAQQAPGSEGDHGHARVNVNTPFLKVKVVALKFTSNDGPEKVLAFYRDKLGNYGTVVECKGGSVEVGPQLGNGRGMDSPVACDKVTGSGDEIRLKVGTEGNQHVVSVKPVGKGSEFELVYVRLGSGKGDDDYSGRQPS